VFEYAVKAEFPMFTKFTDLGLFQFLITFETRELAEDILKEDKDLLSVWFEEARMWSERDFCSSRSLCMEILGLPPHAWNNEGNQL